MIKQVTILELDLVDQLALSAIQKMSEDGIPQWFLDYPRAKHFQVDIEQKSLYGFYETDVLLGVVCIKPEDETDTAYLDLNNWFHKKSLVIHRLLVSPNARGKGIAKAFFYHAETLANEWHYNSIKVDTHEKNYKMRGLIQKFGYTYQGYLPSINRFAYEKVIKCL